MRWLAIAIVFVSRLAFAHQTSVKYVDVAIDGTRAEITFRVAPGDVTEPLHLAADSKPTAEQAATPEVAAYVAAWFALTSWGEPCTASAPAARVDEDDKFVAIEWTARCPRAPDEADFTHFFALDHRHAAIVRVTSTTDGELSTIVRASDPHLALRERPSLFAWIRAGIHHIVDWDGRDHISFVLALLLVVMLMRDDRERWQVRTFVPTLRSTATVITAFTIAHSLSLIAAALGWVQLRPHLVESLIAVSIAYTAAENIVKPDVRWRFVLTFGFGLVHGLGFASTLAAMLPPRDVIVPLLCFNVGVEVGQLTIVLLALPVFFVLAREVGAERYRRSVMPAISALIFAAGVYWVATRI
ncbi:MAG: HupE/UreJ family protein [Acidobacteriota bacterium]